ncbi:flagellar hook-length control protein FliK [Oceaniglobus indicus]|uniref:flagellar hook-length control protein FliK n=1 Tax=Oceaniglobus indicus TaxID=2047749 RepID=UPI000C18E1A4|nr:flagellar hook-length control protein FliK [Oceaniglobus indicus]
MQLPLSAKGFAPSQPISGPGVSRDQGRDGEAAFRAAIAYGPPDRGKPDGNAASALPGTAADDWTEPAVSADDTAGVTDSTDQAPLRPDAALIGKIAPADPDNRETIDEPSMEGDGNLEVANRVSTWPGADAEHPVTPAAEMLTSGRKPADLPWHVTEVGRAPVGTAPHGAMQPHTDERSASIPLTGQEAGPEKMKPLTHNEMVRHGSRAEGGLSSETATASRPTISMTEAQVQRSGDGLASAANTVMENMSDAPKNSLPDPALNSAQARRVAGSVTSNGQVPNRPETSGATDQPRIGDATTSQGQASGSAGRDAVRTVDSHALAGAIAQRSSRLSLSGSADVVDARPQAIIPGHGGWMPDVKAGAGIPPPQPAILTGSVAKNTAFPNAASLAFTALPAEDAHTSEATDITAHQISQVAPRSLSSAPLPVSASQATVAPPPALEQVVRGLGGLGTGPVEIALSPEELGRVRMTLSHGDGAVNVTVMAERDETLTLLRRNIDMLATELRDLGFLNLSFQFSRNDNKDGRQHKVASTAETTTAPPPNDAPPAAAGTTDAVSARLDIRL